MVRRRSSLILALGLVVIAAGCLRQPRFNIPEEAEGHTWFSAPPSGLRRVPRYGVEILTNPRRGVQEVWYRHRYRSGLDAKIDELHAPGSLLWSPDGRWLAVNHRDYPSLGDFLLFHLEHRRLIERGGMMDRVQELWRRLHPEPMASFVVAAARWSKDSSKLLLLVVGVPDGANAKPVHQALWLDPRDGVLRLAEVDPGVWSPLEASLPH